MRDFHELTTRIQLMVKQAFQISAVTVLVSLLMIVGIFLFTRDVYEVALLLVIPLGLAAWFLGWRTGIIFGLLTAMLLAPGIEIRVSLVTPSMPFALWISLGVSFLIFGMLMGLQGETVRQSEEQQLTSMQEELARARESVEHYESMIDGMVDGHQRLQRMNEELALLNTIATSVNSSLNIDKIQNAAIANIYSLVEIDEAQIYWITHHDEQFVLRSSRNMSHEEIAAIPPVNVTDGLLGRVRESQRIITITNRRGADSLELPPSIGAEITDILAVPLLSRSRLLGVLVLGRKGGHAFSDDDRNFIASVGRILTVALENATLFQQAQDMSLTDEVTGLANRRMFNLRLSMELSRAKGSHSDLCLVLFDLDYFKTVNDRYGHPAGDEVLYQFAHRVQRDIRGTDLICRIGGEEFALMLPDTPLEIALKVANRICEHIANAPFTLADGVEVAMTVSGGIAGYTRNIDDCDEFVTIADQALYQAKRHGRNRIEVAGAQPALAVAP